MERLAEAIEKYKELSKEKDCLARTFRGFRDYGNPKSTITSEAEESQHLSEEYAQLAEWLEELSQYKELLPTPQMVKDLINMNRKHEKNALENAHIVDDYRQKQEQGLLIELPCKVGDTVWGLINYCNDCPEYADYCHRGCEKPRYRLKDFKVNHFEIHNNGLRVSALSHYDGEGMWGENVFLTEAEAEEALAKMGGKHENTD